MKSVSNVPGRRAVRSRRPTSDAHRRVDRVRGDLLSLRARDGGVARVGAVRGVRYLSSGSRKARSSRSWRTSFRQTRRGAAYGWYYLAIGIGALPASLLFGALWDRFGQATAFAVGGALALVAAIGLALVPSGPATGDPA